MNAIANLFLLSALAVSSSGGTETDIATKMSDAELRDAALGPGHYLAQIAGREIARRGNFKSWRTVIDKGSESAWVELNFALIREVPKDAVGAPDALILGIERIIRKFPMYGSGSERGGRTVVVSSNAEAIAERLGFVCPKIDPWEDAEVFSFIDIARRALGEPKNAHLRAPVSASEKDASSPPALRQPSVRTVGCSPGFVPQALEPTSAAEIRPLWLMIGLAGLILAVVCAARWWPNARKRTKD